MLFFCIHPGNHAAGDAALRGGVVDDSVLYPSCQERIRKG